MLQDEIIITQILTFIEKVKVKQCCGSVAIIAVPLPSSDIGRILVPVYFRVCFRLRMQFRNRLQTIFKTGLKNFFKMLPFQCQKQRCFTESQFI
jgi:hypothetical protein